MILIRPQRKFSDAVVTKSSNTNQSLQLLDPNKSGIAKQQQQQQQQQQEQQQQLAEIERHGPGDGHITLNVGGKDFYTLRSTVQVSPVLAYHVAQAELNKELTKNGAVFIDRDPEHFGFILNYLRAKSELMVANRQGKQNSCKIFKDPLHPPSFHSFDPFDPKSLLSFTRTQMKFPSDTGVLRELYKEASFYQIQELTETLCGRNWILIFSRILDKSSNPFDFFSKFISRLRAALVTLGSGGALFASTQQDKEWLLNKFGLTKLCNNIEEDIGGTSNKNYNAEAQSILSQNQK